MTREVPAVAFRAVKMVVKSVTSDHEQSAVRRTNAVTHGQLVVHREEPNAIALGFFGPVLNLCERGGPVEEQAGPAPWRRPQTRGLGLPAQQRDPHVCWRPGSSCCV